MVCEQTPQSCPDLYYRDNDSFKKAVLMLLGALVNGEIGDTVGLEAGVNHIGQVSIDAALPTGTNTIGNVGFVTESVIGHGRQVVTTAGVPVALAASTASKRVDVQALSTNTGVIVVGATGVVAAAGSRTGIALNPGQTYSFSIDNLSKVFIDSTVNLEGVSFTYFN